MGRRPNPLILQYFSRGEKLKDQSNRYPHTCKGCGEHFPRGRIDTLTSHLTKKCPVISEAQRMSALLVISGMNSASQVHQQQVQHQQHGQPSQQHVNGLVDLPLMPQPDPQRDWTALGVLAEVSRQIDQQENNDDRGQQPPMTPITSAAPLPPSSASLTDRMELLQQLTADDNEGHGLANEGHGLANEGHGLANEGHGLADIKLVDQSARDDQDLAEMLRAENASTETASLAMAAAATARLHPALHPALLDPQLLGAEAAAAAAAATASAASAANAESSANAETATDAVNEVVDTVMTVDAEPEHAPVTHPAYPETAEAGEARETGETEVVGKADPEEHPALHAQPAPLAGSPETGHTPFEHPSLIPVTSAAQPWGEITYAAESFQASVASDAAHAAPMTRGGFRLESNNAKSRHSRQRFSAERREQVKDVRKIGACIRCRILRKTCSKGEPCDTCRKVLAPRIWRSGCIRTKFTEQLDMYTASVQIVLAQNRVNAMKQSMPLSNQGTVVEVGHFPGEHFLKLQVLQTDSLPGVEVPEGETPRHNIVMLDSDSQDVPAKIEQYMRDVLQELIKREPSNFVRVTLTTALDISTRTHDELLRKALELWGYVELLDRERQWAIAIKDSDDAPPTRHITEAADSEIYATICLQLSAAVERKAGVTSKALLTGMQRVLQDSKVKIDFSMYFATMILLNCVEKSTWAFKAWEQANLRPNWPLPKEPDSFAQQGHVIANLLRMLLGIRKAIPQTACRESDRKLIAIESDPEILAYFEQIDLDWDHIRAQENPTFCPSNPRCFEFKFCSILLLPPTD